jgi:predicted DsbA family dithiol-disulfide isomerase
MIDRMVEVGRAIGLAFRFDRVRPTNTFDAHRLLSWAAETGRQNELEERLFVAYLNQGLVVSDHAVLADLAGEAGLDAGEARAVLSSDAHAEAVRSEERQAARLGVTGVPFFVIGERHAVAGAQPADVLLGAMRQAASAAGEPPRVESDGGERCSEDGCAIGPADPRS